MTSNPWFTPLDDEIAIIDVAARPAFAMRKLFLSGGGQHEHPPLSDLILHGWLNYGNIHLLRLPSLIFYLLGAWCLVDSARRMAGDRARNGTLILLLLWPYGIHLGRLAGWYSFTFLLVSLLTLVYLKYIERPSPRTWMPVVLCALALVDSNYFGWAVLGFFGPGSFIAIRAGAADADDQSVADPSHQDHARDVGAAIRRTVAGRIADFGGRDWLVWHFLAQILRCAALDRTLGSSGTRSCGSCGQRWDRYWQQSFVLFLHDVFDAVHESRDERIFCGAFAGDLARAQRLHAAARDRGGVTYHPNRCGFRWAQFRGAGSFDGRNSC